MFLLHSTDTSLLDTIDHTKALCITEQIHVGVAEDCCLLFTARLDFEIIFRVQ